MTELEWMDIFSDNLVEMMKDAGMTQRELADAAGLSESVVSYYINKQRVPGLKAIINLADVLNCTTAELIDFGDTIE